MTPDERQLISDLFDRMRANGHVDKDGDAENLINQSVRQTPDAAYLLVQSVLAQEHYLQQAAGRIQELEAQLRDVQDEAARLQQAQASAPQRSSGGSFLGGLFGGGGQPAQQPVQRSAGSVPSFSANRQPASPPAQAGSPWGQQPGQAQRAGAFGQRGSFGPQAGQQAGTQSGGPSFMRSALTTAAGVAGGMLAANAISGMLNGGSSANAAHTPDSTAASGEPSPFEVNNPADQQRQLDEQQDLAQDAELENQQYASLDDGDTGDWGSFDDSEY